LRPLIIGASLLALVTGFTTPAPGSEIIQNPNGLFPSVRWDFSTATNTFSGEPVGQFINSSLVVRGSLQAVFDGLGNFQTGDFELRRDDNNALLMQGTVTGVSPQDTVSQTHFRVIFTLDIDFTSPLLGFTAQFGDFEAFVCNGSDLDCQAGSDGPTSLAGLFTTDYTDSFMPLNNLLHTFATVPIPSPLPGVLLGLGVAVLVAMRMRRLI
jgi:hypothetical protein